MENTLGSVDVPLTLFQGLNTELAPTDVPEGQSPDTQDVAYLPGSVFSRPCAHKLFTDAISGDVTVVYAKKFVQANGDPLNLFLDSAGILWKEDVNSAPGFLTEVVRVAPNSLATSVTELGREYLAISDGITGTEQPIQFDGENIDRVSQDGVGEGPTTVADSPDAGNIPAGVHGVVEMFLTRQGYLTAPSPPKYWTAAGNFKVRLTGLAIGPENVIARVLAFTGAGGANYFTILAPVTVGGVAVPALIVPDNSTTTIDFDFTDLALLAATAIDIPGNNLFELQVLRPSIGVTSYASRMAWWGENNAVSNFLNMGFEGGYRVLTTPLGWTLISAGGTLEQVEIGMGWTITGNGGAGTRGQISQGAYQDAYGIAILQPLTQYTFRVRVTRANEGQSGYVIASFSSATLGGVFATASVQINNGSVIGKFLEADFNAATPASVPADTELLVYTFGQANLEVVTIDELEIIYTADPTLNDQLRVSYVNNPESFDGLTGVLGPASDPSPMRSTFQIRETLYLQTADRLHATSDNGTGEPSTWTVAQIADECGALSVRGTAVGDTWAAWASKVGALHFSGGVPTKMSQKIQPDWESINLAAQQYIWAVNDQKERRIYFGLPLDDFETPNLIYPFDYKEIETDISVPGEGQVTKWTRWNLKANCGAILARPNNADEFCIGAGNGEALGEGEGYGNAYYFDPDKLTDDDYGAMDPYYVTHFFLDQNSVLGSHRKLAAYLTFFATGVGNMEITPYAGALTNPVTTAPLLPLSLSQNYDLEVGLNVLAERVAFKFMPLPEDGETDVQFALSNMCVTLKKDVWSPIRGCI